jgi:hypothetical protein
MLPKSKWQIYVGFDDGAKAVKYYSAEMCKILTSCNFHNINPPPEMPPNQLSLHPVHSMREPGNSDMPLPGANDSDGMNQDQPSKQKQKRREEKMSVNISEPRIMHRIHTDYKHLNEQGNQTEYIKDPFDEGDDETSLITEEMYAAIAGDELTTLAEAKCSPD